ncbi:MAG: DegT/DnrJ/EryC1/StrS family aminotransferase [Bryobacterales bacterium]|jgi:dTDP-3-amino-3,4,6-trideoxy-alpha-D-glucose transaminase|nr:DegT/DnrJ/EryC1/StrS family aminotransferase [Bryobacterales bacterium]
MVDLREALHAAQAAIASNLEQMHARGQYILGPQTEAFEEAFAAATGGSYAVGVGSGTAALELSLRAAGIGLGADGTPDEVIVPAMTSLFTAQAVLATGARLVVADVSPEDLLVSAETLRATWTKRTRAVIAVHLYGQPCRLEEIAALCAERNAVLVQDACQAHGARVQGRPLTKFSPYCAYSFYPTKNLGALGDGGAIVTDDPEVAERLRLLRDGGRLGDQLCRQPGHNSRLHEMQACYLNAFLPYLEGWNDRRRVLARRYRGALSGTVTPLLRFDADSVNHLVVARSSTRDALRQHLAACGIQSGIHYPVPIHEQPGLLEFASWKVQPQVASQAAREIVSLPVAPHVSNAMADAVLQAVLEFQP